MGRTRSSTRGMFLRVPEGPALSPSFKAFTFVASELGAIVQWISKVKQGLDATTTAVSSGFTVFYNALNSSQKGAVGRAVEKERVASQPRNWADLTDAQKTAVQKILDLGDLSKLPEDSQNKAILEYVLKNVVPTLDYTGGIFKGDDYGTGDEQCKPWIQSWLLREDFTSKPIPATQDSDVKGVGDYQWKPNSDDRAPVTVVTSLDGQKTFAEMIDFENPSRAVQAGDILQMGYGSIPHTALITKIEKEGIWVLDTNFGPKVPVLTADKNKATGLMENGKYRDATEQEKQAGLATHFLREDNTVRIHFLPFEVKDANNKITGGLHAKVSMATIYRISQ